MVTSLMEFSVELLIGEKPLNRRKPMLVGGWLIENCPNCGIDVNKEFVAEDEVGDDINIREKRREYRETQKGNNPYTHSCGTKLIPLIKV